MAIFVRQVETLEQRSLSTEFIDFLVCTGKIFYVDKFVPDISPSGGICTCKIIYFDIVFAAVSPSGTKKPPPPPLRLGSS